MQKRNVGVPIVTRRLVSVTWTRLILQTSLECTTFQGLSRTDVETTRMTTVRSADKGGNKARGQVWKELLSDSRSIRYLFMLHMS